MKTPEQLKRKKLNEVVADIQSVLYGVAYTDAKGRTRVRYDRNKVWDVDTIERVDEVMVEADLSPEDDLGA